MEMNIEEGAAAPSSVLKSSKKGKTKKKKTAKGSKKANSEGEYLFSCKRSVSVNQM